MAVEQPNGAIHLQSEKDESHSNFATWSIGGGWETRSPTDGDEFLGSEAGSATLMAIDTCGGFELQDENELVYATWTESPLTDRGFHFSRGQAALHPRPSPLTP